MSQTHLMLLLLRSKHQLDAVIPHLTHLAHEDTLIILAQNGYGQLEHISFKTYAKQLSYMVKRKAMLLRTSEIINYVYKIIH